MNFAAIFFWNGVGVSGLSEKSAYGMESSGVREEEESSLVINTYLFFLVYLGKAKPNVPRGRDVRPCFRNLFFQSLSGLNSFWV